jgi:hypothetical protein
MYEFMVHGTAWTAAEFELMAYGHAASICLSIGEISSLAVISIW